MKCNIKSISNNLFENCSGFYCELSIPDKVISIGEIASVQSIGEMAFFDCDGMNGTLCFSSSLSRIGYSSFNNTQFDLIKFGGDKMPKCDGFIGFPYDQIIDTNKNYEEKNFCSYNVTNYKETHKKRGLSAGAIAGIVFGTIFRVAVIILVVLGGIKLYKIKHPEGFVGIYG